MAQRYPGFSGIRPASAEPARRHRGATAPARDHPPAQDAAARGPGIPERCSGCASRQEQGAPKETGQGPRPAGRGGQKVPIFGPQHEQCCSRRRGMGGAEHALPGRPRGAQAGSNRRRAVAVQDAMEKLAKQSGQGRDRWHADAVGGFLRGRETGRRAGVGRRAPPRWRSGRGVLAGARGFRKEPWTRDEAGPAGEVQGRVKQYYEELVK